MKLLLTAEGGYSETMLHGLNRREGRQRPQHTHTHPLPTRSKAIRRCCQNWMACWDSGMEGGSRCFYKLLLFPSLLLSFHEVQLVKDTVQRPHPGLGSPSLLGLALGGLGLGVDLVRSSWEHRTFLSPVVLIRAGQRAHFPCA